MANFRYRYFYQRIAKFEIHGRKFCTKMTINDSIIKFFDRIFERRIPWYQYSCKKSWDKKWTGILWKCSFLYEIQNRIMDLYWFALTCLIRQNDECPWILESHSNQVYFVAILGHRWHNQINYMHWVWINWILIRWPN